MRVKTYWNNLSLLLKLENKQTFTGRPFARWGVQFQTSALRLGVKNRDIGKIKCVGKHSLSPPFKQNLINEKSLRNYSQNVQANTFEECSRKKATVQVFHRDAIHKKWRLSGHEKCNKPSRTGGISCRDDCLHFKQKLAMTYSSALFGKNRKRNNGLTSFSLTRVAVIHTGQRSHYLVVGKHLLFRIRQKKTLAECFHFNQDFCLVVFLSGRRGRSAMTKPWGNQGHGGWQSGTHPGRSGCLAIGKTLCVMAACSGLPSPGHTLPGP